MIDPWAVGVNAFNVAVTIGLLLYSVKVYGLFKGGTIGGSIRILIGSAFFTALAVIVRSAIEWQLLGRNFGSVELILRSFGFVLLFVFVFYLFRHVSRGVGGER